MIPENVVKQIERCRPKLLLVSPNFSNPTGILWSLERRQQVLSICKSEQILIVEDNSYGDLHFDGRTEEDFIERYPSLFALMDLVPEIKYYISVHLVKQLPLHYVQAGLQAIKV
ncbi:hypothetical protein JCM16418_185 [Paenibacillus pini JCM 16418]|uniref:Aminotransferase class I/classII large domain-containing protein n=1 Tax=Paenibacillus pini JCM 16418 TaxID=1236976 RepID=W7Y5Z7_9BACL|nr:hypothetical protein JCM16418_185 [Paenibacillus pini JCM 16418]